VAQPAAKRWIDHVVSRRLPDRCPCARSPLAAEPLVRAAQPHTDYSLPGQAAYASAE